MLRLPEETPFRAVSHQGGRVLFSGAAKVQLLDLATSRLFVLSPDRSFASPGDVFALAPSGRELWAL